MYQSPKITLLYPQTEEVLNEDVTEASEEETDNLISVGDLLNGLIKG